MSTRVVERHDDAGAERRLGGARALERERHVELVGPHEDARGAAEQDGLQRPPVRDAAREVEQVAQRRAEATS